MSEVRLVIEIKAAERATQSAKALATAAGGISRSHFTAMYYIRLQPGIASAPLARVAGVTPQSMGETIGRLVANGLVRQSPHETNAKLICLHLTGEGVKALETADVRLQELESYLSSELTEIERTTLIGVLAKVTALANTFTPRP